MEETTPVSGGYAPLMVTDGPIPFVPSLCGALAATALVVWEKARCPNGACGGDPARRYGLGRLLLYTLVVLLSGWLVMVAEEGIFGTCAFCFSSYALLSADERRKRWAESRTRPMKPWQFFICLLPIAPLYIFIGLVIFNDGRTPSISPETLSLWQRFKAWVEVLRSACVGAFVILMADAILSAWGQWFAARRASPTPKSR